VSSRVERGIRRRRQGRMIRFVLFSSTLVCVLMIMVDVARTSTSTDVAHTRPRCSSQRGRDSWHRATVQFLRVANLCRFASSVSRRFGQEESACEGTCDGGVQGDCAASRCAVVRVFCRLGSVRVWSLLCFLLYLLAVSVSCYAYCIACSTWYWYLLRTLATCTSLPVSHTRVSLTRCTVVQLVSTLLLHIGTCATVSRLALYLSTTSCCIQTASLVCLIRSETCGALISSHVFMKSCVVESVGFSRAQPVCTTQRTHRQDGV